METKPKPYCPYQKSEIEYCDSLTFLPKGRKLPIWYQFEDAQSCCWCIGLCLTDALKEKNFKELKMYALSIKHIQQRAKRLQNYFKKMQELERKQSEKWRR